VGRLGLGARHRLGRDSLIDPGPRADRAASTVTASATVTASWPTLQFPSLRFGGREPAALSSLIFFVVTMRGLLLISLCCCLFSFVNCAVKIEGTLAGGEVAKGKWTPNYSFLQPFKKKVEKVLPSGKVEKIHNFLENIHVPGCSLDIVVRFFDLKALFQSLL
jgi:hypothetical protein